MSDLRRLRRARLGRESDRSVNLQSGRGANEESARPQAATGEVAGEHTEAIPYHRRRSNRYETKKPDEVLAEWTIAVAAFTGVLALASVASDVFSYRTLRAINGQLHEMQTSGAQTDQIIAADKALADAAKAQAAAANSLADITQKNIELSQRAWVGPNGATINAAPVLGADATFIITYQNTGREPARDAVITAKPFVVTADSNGNSNLPDLNDRVKNCRQSEPPLNGETIFPNTGLNGANQFSLKIDKNAITESVVKGQSVIGLTGCIAYRTFGLTRHSSFCFFYKNGLTTLPNLNFCLAGGFAD